MSARRRRALAALQAATTGAPFPRASAFGLSPGLGSPGPLGRLSAAPISLCRRRRDTQRLESFVAGSGRLPVHRETLPKNSNLSTLPHHNIFALCTISDSDHNEVLRRRVLRSL